MATKQRNARGNGSHGSEIAMMNTIMPVGRRFVKVGGVRISYVHAGSGPAIVLLHGLSEFLETWYRNVLPLAERLSVWAPDLPGHGRSGRDDTPYTMEYCRWFVTAFMDAVGIKQATLVGRSLGGAIALSVAREHPERVERLALISSGGYEMKVPIGYRLALVPGLGDIMLGPPILASESLMRFFLRRHFETISVSEDYVRLMLRHGMKRDRNQFIRHVIRSNATLTSSHPRGDVGISLPDLSMPVLVIHGEKDRVVPVQQAREAATQIPDARVVVISDCGHNPQLECSDEVNRVLLEFVLGKTE